MTQTRLMGLPYGVALGVNVCKYASPLECLGMNN